MGLCPLSYHTTNICRISIQQYWKEKEEQKEAISEAEKAAENGQTRQANSVLVLQWNNQTADYTDPTLQRNVASAIDRTEITFLPAVDLYQGGREI